MDSQHDIATTRKSIPLINRVPRRQYFTIKDGRGKPCFSKGKNKVGRIINKALKTSKFIDQTTTISQKYLDRA